MIDNCGWCLNCGSQLTPACPATQASTELALANVHVTEHTKGAVAWMLKIWTINGIYGDSIGFLCLLGSTGVYYGLLGNLGNTKKIPLESRVFFWESVRI